MSNAVNGGRGTRSRALVIGYVLSGLAATMLVLDAVFKLLVAPQVVSATRELGWPTDTATIRGLGTGLLVATLLYAIPRTALIGAVLLTGYLGGAIATHARIGSPLFTHTFFGAYLAVLLWAGLILRSATVRTAFAAHLNGSGWVVTRIEERR